VNPPVEAPASRHGLPDTSMPKDSSAASSFSPARETKRLPPITESGWSGGKRVPALVTTLSPARTAPARIRPCARLRVSARPRSTIRVSSRWGVASIFAG
jgi:hypothetical protein